MLNDAEATLVRAELETDPEGMGYAAVAGEPAALLSLLFTGSPNSRRAKARVTRSEFLLAIAPAAFRIAQLDANGQRAWDRVLGMIQAAESVTVSDPGVQAMLAAGVAQGVITQAEADALTWEPCPRVEAVLGRPNVLLTPEDLE